MDNIEFQLENNIKALINDCQSNNIDKIYVSKLLKFVNSRYHVQMNYDSMVDLLNKIGVSTIDGDIISVGVAPKDEQEKEEVEDNVREKASKQAFDNITSNESYVGKIFDIDTLQLNESMDYYHMLYAAKKNKLNLICTECLNDKFEFKIDTTPYKVIVDVKDMKGKK